MKRPSLIVLSAWMIIGSVAAGDNLSAGRDAYNAGEYEKAYDLFSAAFRVNPAGIDENLALGDAAAKRKKFSHAVFAYDRVLMARPNHEKALLGKAAALLALGQTDEARDAYSTVLNATTDGTVRDSALNSIRQIDKSTRELVVHGKVFLSGVYDDNVNYGNDDDNISPSTPVLSKETAGMEGGLDLQAEYDMGRKDDWMLIGGMSFFDSWYDVAQDQEIADSRIHAGLRNSGKRNLFEIVGRGESMRYGGNTLVDIYGADGAWLFAAEKNQHFITCVTLESRNYDSEFDSTASMNDRDSIYAQVGETWKYCHGKKNNSVSLGVDLLSENARNDMNSYLGYRLRADGQVELPGGVITYAGGRYRFGKYDDPDLASGLDREDDRWDLLVGAKCQLTDRVWLDLYYLHVWNTSTVPAMEYDRNRVSLSAICEF